MTICIAIVCDSLQTQGKTKLILITDSMLSLGITSSDTAQKAFRLHNDWYVMYAGSDISLVTPILVTASTMIESGIPPPVALPQAYQRIRRMQVENVILSPLDWTIERFLEIGDTKLPESEFAKLYRQVQDFDAGCQFLVCSLSNKKEEIPVFFYVSNPGYATPSDFLGYAAIGSGYPIALTYLARREQAPWFSLAATLYNGLAAKDLARKAEGVGEETVVVIVEQGKEPYLLKPNQIKAIMKIWKEEEKEIRPINLDKRVSEILKSP